MRQNNSVYVLSQAATFLYPNFAPSGLNRIRISYAHQLWFAWPTPFCLHETFVFKLFYFHKTKSKATIYPTQKNASNFNLSKIVQDYKMFRYKC